MPVDLYPHQREAVEKMSNGKVLVGGVGTGKTLTALVYFYEKVLGGTVGDFGSIKKVVDLYVFTTARKRDENDWEWEAAKLGISTDRDSSATGVQLTVDSYNNIEKYRDIHDAFIILDEQRMVGSGAWTKAFIKMAKTNRWIMLSATPGDKWEDFIPLFVANGFYRNRTHFIREHCVYSYFGSYPKLERYMGEWRLYQLRDKILVFMPYERHTTRHIHQINVDYDKELFEKVLKKRWHVYENRPLKDVAELFSVMRKVVNSDAARLDSLRTLLRTHPKVIVFYNFDYELEMLRTLATDTAIFQDAMDNSAIVSTRPGSDRTSDPSGLMKSAMLSSQPMTKEQTISPCSTTSKTSSRPVESQSTRQDVLLGMENIRQTPASIESLKTENCGRNQTWDTSSQNIDQLQKNFSKPKMKSTASGSDSWSGTPENLKNKQNRPSEQSAHPSSRETFQTSNLDGLTVRIQQPASTTSSDSSVDTSDTSRHSSTNASVVERGSTERCGKRRTTSMTSTTTSGSTTHRTSEAENHIPNRATTTGKPNSQEMLQSESSVQIAEWNGHKHQPIPKSDRWVYLVQYAAGAEAWNCTETDTIIFFSLTYSYKHFHQAQGRIDRLDTPYSDLHYYVLSSKSMIDQAIWKSLRNKESFNESQFLKKR